VAILEVSWEKLMPFCCGRADLGRVRFGVVSDKWAEAYFL